MKNGSGPPYSFEQDSPLNYLISEKELNDDKGKGNFRKKEELGSERIEEVDEKTSMDKIIYKDQAGGLSTNKINNLISDVSAITRDQESRK